MRAQITVFADAQLMPGKDDRLKQMRRGARLTLPSRPGALLIVGTHSPDD